MRRMVHLEMRLEINDAGNINGSGAVDGTAENGVASASDGTGNPAALNGETAKKPGLMRDKLTINANREEYGDGRAQISIWDWWTRAAISLTCS